MSRKLGSEVRLQSRKIISSGCKRSGQGAARQQRCWPDPLTLWGTQVVAVGPLLHRLLDNSQLSVPTWEEVRPKSDFGST